MADAYVNFTAVLHGIDPGHVELRRDEKHDTWWLRIGRGVSVRVDLKCPDDLPRDRAGLLKLGEAATRLAEEIRQQQERDGSDE